ncbi:hypothetical protein HP550_17990 [Cellulomonas humilata]|uniref:Lipoprotein n=1 Tax=Cellulomonas humilata TaxID=144055 RepID=A0A7Y6A504_9CELL|nr:hypothetical protein [Cellulomonas humilata]NUU19143.1 hypothetical protein [Cellulomonas humilata]
MTVRHRLAAVLGAVALVATLAGCIDHPPDAAELTNESDQPVVVTFEGSDEVVELPAREGRSLPGDECVGTGIVVSAQDGTVLASFDGGACTTTILTVHDDGEVTVHDRGQDSARPTRDG